MAVGMGSENPPRFIIMEYNSQNKKQKKKAKLLWLERE